MSMNGKRDFFTVEFFKVFLAQRLARGAVAYERAVDTQHRGGLSREHVQIV
ncbi:MAG: hypothetical protein UX10_C0008G0026 [Candidatus Magasanikbacteria bacterium GW2011_GWA2_45_39]|uniref:Uncharacterized protein n=1 Tax=Candidatus Magasanikbacteria bacterium GW2011_GWA2_45_39 TaxID=1619041 RepID=A0A0G1PQE3_9BACT|nr:MAG: hypothetical protein UX10_C0008G0026 [Candidatus Magasanikbacteria bacterium GW2011_GWA2_45_39]